MSVHTCRIDSVGGSKQGARASAMSWFRYIEREAEYGNKDGKVESFVKLPEGAPQEWSDPHKLWGAVAKHEDVGARTGREFMVAFQNELNYSQNLEAVHAFTDQLVAAGFPAHVAIHSAKSGALHAHITIPDRKLENGEWAKTKRVSTYLVRKEGEEDKFIDAEEWKSAKGEGWEKVFPFKDGEQRTKSEAIAAGLDWKLDRKGTKPIRSERSEAPTSKAKLVEWRKSWADCVNAALAKYAPEAEQVSHLSYAERGIDKVPTVHLGALATNAERAGIETIKGTKNREISKVNELLENDHTPEELKDELVEHGYEINRRIYANPAQVKAHNRPVIERIAQVVRQVIARVQQMISPTNRAESPVQAHISPSQPSHEQRAIVGEALQDYIDQLNELSRAEHACGLASQGVAELPYSAAQIGEDADKLGNLRWSAESHRNIEPSRLKVKEHKAWKDEQQSREVELERFEQKVNAKYGSADKMEAMRLKAREIEGRRSDATFAVMEAKRGLEHFARRLGIVAHRNGYTSEMLASLKPGTSDRQEPEALKNSWARVTEAHTKAETLEAQQRNAQQRQQVQSIDDRRR